MACNRFACSASAYIRLLWQSPVNYVSQVIARSLNSSSQRRAPLAVSPSLSLSSSPGRFTHHLSPSHLPARPRPLRTSNNHVKQLRLSVCNNCTLSNANSCVHRAPASVSGQCEGVQQERRRGASLLRRPPSSLPS